MHAPSDQPDGAQERGAGDPAPRSSAPSSSAAEPSATGADSGPAPVTSARPSVYGRPTRKNTSLRNMMWALGLTMAVVVAIGIGFFGAGGDQGGSEVPEHSRVDVAASAERAQADAEFPLAVPQLGEGWIERSARFTAGEQPSWEIRYSSPDGQLVTLVEEAEVSVPTLSAALPGAVVEEEIVIDGVPCRLLGGAEGQEAHGLSCEDQEWGLLVHGAVPTEELEELARAAIDSLA